MKEILLIGLGMAAGLVLAAAMSDNTNNGPKPTFEHPYIYWNDYVHRPEHGFEKSVDIYENEVGDTIFMELSYGYEND